METQPPPLIDVDATLTVGDFTLEFRQAWSTATTAIFGPSGVGKSLLIELLAGFRRPDRGYIRFQGEVLDDGAGSFVPARRRGFGWVPQDLALWPHLSVKRNVEYAARRTDRRLLERAIELLEIGNLLNRRPSQLSGGQQQRVALARAVASSPRLLLLDEPLSSLDAVLRSRIVPYVRRLERELHIPYIYVSHDRHELYALAGRVIVMQAGRAVAAGSPEHVFGRASRPQYLETDRFENRYPAVIERIDEAAGIAYARVSESLVFALPLAIAPATGEALELGLDAADILLSRDAPTGISAQNIIPVKVDAVTDERGPSADHPAPVAVHLRHDSGAGFKVLVTQAAARDLALNIGADRHLLFKAHAVHVL